jgi:hypothetical protein
MIALELGICISEDGLEVKFGRAYLDEVEVDGREDGYIVLRQWEGT